VAAELLDLGFDAFNVLSKDNASRQIIASHSGVANFRSPVIASAVLSGLKSASVITEVVSECVKRGHLAKNADPFLGTISKELMRFANLERILPEKGKRRALQNLYESIKSVSTIRNNPHFWLQYAMARLSLGELDVARRYFEQSYSYAKSINGYDTFQIDNHYCRLLLKEAENTTDADEAYKAVDEALTTLKKASTSRE
jgi:tetratricopeptide (TPR) repeat protein